MQVDEYLRKFYKKQLMLGDNLTLSISGLEETTTYSFEKNIEDTDSYSIFKITNKIIGEEKYFIMLKNQFNITFELKYKEE